MCCGICGCFALPDVFCSEKIRYWEIPVLNTVNLSMHDFGWNVPINSINVLQ